MLVDAVTQETVAHVDLTVDQEPDATVEVVPVEIPTPPSRVRPTRYRWESERSIEGRVYRRTDTRVPDVASSM
jgi:hypothetical protein